MPAIVGCTLRAPLILVEPADGDHLIDAWTHGLFMEGVEFACLFCQRPYNVAIALHGLSLHRAG